MSSITVDAKLKIITICIVLLCCIYFIFCFNVSKGTSGSLQTVVKAPTR